MALSARTTPPTTTQTAEGRSVGTAPRDAGGPQRNDGRPHPDRESGAGSGGGGGENAGPERGNGSGLRGGNGIGRRAEVPRAERGGAPALRAAGRGGAQGPRAAAGSGWGQRWEDPSSP